MQLEELRTCDGRPLPAHLKTQISRELDRLEMCELELVGEPPGQDRGSSLVALSGGEECTVEALYSKTRM
jgi:hypothetical protein